VAKYLNRAREAGVSWPLPEELDDGSLQRRLFGERSRLPSTRPPPDCPRIQRELKHKHVTLRLLWEEYKEEHPDGYQFSWFADVYRRWEGSLKVWMRQIHKGGEKLFVDYSGDGVPMVDPRTGEYTEAQLFVAVMGASNYTYAEATATQQLPDWLRCHVHALEFLGGVPELIVPDQPRTSTKTPCRYDPELNPAYRELGEHYSTCILPARPRRPRDKAKVEVGVQIAQRWIIAALRHRTFFSLGALNAAIRELLERLNGRPMRKLGRSRRELFEELDRPQLRPLPETPYEFAAWKIGVRVSLDYHVEFERNYYSVPYRYAQKTVEIRATQSVVEIFLERVRIASHPRVGGKHHHVTTKDHMPRSHQKHLEWTPSRIVTWGESVGPSTAALLGAMMAARPHPEQGYRACLGVLRLAKRYGEARLEKAAKRALAARTLEYRSINAILKHKLEDEPLPERSDDPLPAHENVRGSQYYA
jgi:transposase